MFGSTQAINDRLRIGIAGARERLAAKYSRKQQSAQSNNAQEAEESESGQGQNAIGKAE